MFCYTIPEKPLGIDERFVRCCFYHLYLYNMLNLMRKETNKIKLHL